MVICLIYVNKNNNNLYQLFVTICPSIPISHANTIVKFRCNMLKCPLARLSGLQCYNMGHNGRGINLYDVRIILMGNYHAGGHYDRGRSVLVHR